MVSGYPQCWRREWLLDNQCTVEETKGNGLFSRWGQVSAPNPSSPCCPFFSLYPIPVKPFGLCQEHFNAILLLSLSFFFLCLRFYCMNNIIKESNVGVCAINPGSW